MRRKRYDPLAPENVLEALMRMAAEQVSRRNLKGSKRSREIAEKTQATKRRRYKQRMRAALRRRLAAKPKGRKWEAAFGDRIVDHMVRAMAPGQWYGRGDIIQACGYGRPQRGKVNQALLPSGLVERRRNPAYAGHVDPRRAARGMAEPLWLYRLTRLGELQREALALIS